MVHLQPIMTKIRIQIRILKCNLNKVNDFLTTGLGVMNVTFEPRVIDQMLPTLLFIVILQGGLARYTYYTTITFLLWIYKFRKSDISDIYIERSLLCNCPLDIAIVWCNHIGALFIVMSFCIYMKYFKGLQLKNDAII